MRRRTKSSAAYCTQIFPPSTLPFTGWLVKLIGSFDSQLLLDQLNAFLCSTVWVRFVLFSFSIHRSQRDAVVDGWCVRSWAVHCSLWSLFHLARLPGWKCAPLLGTSWLEGCCRKSLGVGCFGKVSIIASVRLSRKNQPAIYSTALLVFLYWRGGLAITPVLT